MENVKTRICSICNTEKLLTLEFFHKDSSRKDGFAYPCKICFNIRDRENYNSEKEKLRYQLKYKKNKEKDPLYVYKNNLKRRWHLSWEQYTERFSKQGNCCAICKTIKRPDKGWVIDHDHDCCPSRADVYCGKCIRGILCQDCNFGIGRLKDNPAILQEAINYLEKYKESKNESCSNL
jgi:hypothetical protein